jgi:GWxTD domain-containing protein
MSPPRWLQLLLALPVLLAPLALSAQAPDARLQLSRLRDSVVQIATAEAAATFAKSERTTVDASKTDAIRLMQAGLAQWRLGQFSTDRAPLDQAQTLFDEAIYRAPDDWPWPWYGLALADLALDSTDAVVKASMHSGAGVYYHDAALHALGQALEADSSFLPAAALLGDILLPFGERSLNDELKRAVHRAAATNQVPLPWLALGRVYRNLHQADSALAAFRKFVALGGDSGLGLLEQARSLYQQGQLDAGTNAYYSGARVADSLARVNYRRDLAWIASPEELAAFDAAARDSLGQFIQAFWAKRDAEELRAPGERLAEHVRRWRYVFEHFQLSARAEGTPQRNGANCGEGMFPSLGEDAAQPQNMVSPDLQLFEPGVYAATWRGKRLVDDRGLIYMRQGEPDQRAAAALEQSEGVATANAGSASLSRTSGYARVAAPRSSADKFPPNPIQTRTRPNESWKYLTAHGTLLFHFCGSAALGTQAPTTLVEMLPLSPEMMGARAGLDPRFAVLEGELLSMRSASGSAPSTVRSLTTELAREGQRDIQLGLSTDEFSPTFAQRIDPLTQFFAVGQPSHGTGRVLAVFAFAGDQLTPKTLPDGGVAYPIALRFIATDANGRIQRQDTTRYFRAPKALQQGQYLFGTEEMALDAGTWDVRLLVTQPGVDAGGALERRALVLAPGSELGLSDLVFGREQSGLAWQSPHGSVPLSPLDAYPRSGSVEVYYELSGATPGREYHTQVELKGISGEAKGDVKLGFSETASDALMVLRRSVALDPLKGGQYRMTVTVTEEGTGRTATRSRLLNVIR